MVLTSLCWYTQYIYSMLSNIIIMSIAMKTKWTHSYCLSYLSCPEIVKYTNKYTPPRISTDSTPHNNYGNSIPTITAIDLTNCTLISTLTCTKAPD